MEWYRFWRFWLIAVAVFIIVFGFIMALFNATVVFAFFNQQINPVFWGSTPLPASTQAFQSWVYGAWGSTVMGWGITLLFLAWYPFARQERWAWNSIFIGLLLWFILDTGISWWFQVFINVLLNTTIFVLVIIPLLLTWKDQKTL
jgi:hypothetical protein